MVLRWTVEILVCCILELRSLQGLGCRIGFRTEMEEEMVRIFSVGFIMRLSAEFLQTVNLDKPPEPPPSSSYRRKILSDI